MELKGRLRLIADKTPTCRIVADIGTDHAYIPIYLVKNKICDMAIAADVKKGPLRSAGENIKLHGLEGEIATRLGSGLEPVQKEELDVAVIAGMGGQLISEILETSREKAQKATALVLQPMNAPEVLRQWLYENGFCIYDEELVQEGIKLYNVVCARWTGEKKEVAAIYLYIGEKLLEKRDPLLKSLMDRRLLQWKKVYQEIKEGQTGESVTQRQLYQMIVALQDLQNKFSTGKDGW
jgi:tRNA (adenine22-N1)-methyltransferase